MKKNLKKLSVFMLLFMLLITSMSSTAYAKNGFNKKPGSNVGYKEDKKSNGQKVKAPSGDYGWKDTKGRVWIPDGKMHGGQGWTREYPDGSHDHVYEDGNVRVHKSQSNKASSNWFALAFAILLLGAAVLSPIPGDEVIVGGAFLGL